MLWGLLLVPDTALSTLVSASVSFLCFLLAHNLLVPLIGFPAGKQKDFHQFVSVFVLFFVSHVVS